jgi:glycosyltransferase involved in cell wall biosynthesis
LNITIFTPEYEKTGGGIATYYRSILPRLSELGAEVRVIEGSAYHAGANEPRFVDGIPVETLDKARLKVWWERFPEFDSVPGLRQHLAAAWAMWEQSDFGADVDIIEACDWGLLFLPPAVESTRPLVVQAHGSIGQISVHDPIVGEEIPGMLTRLIEKTVMSLATAVQTHSNANAAFWSGETDREVTMIRPAWKAPESHPAAPLVDRGLVVGRVQRWKGPQVVCAALERLGTRAPIVDWIGRDTVWGRRDSSTSAHLAGAYPGIWGRRVFHHPQMPPAEVAQRQAAALFNLVPSIWDVFNFTAIEAMGSGRPTIVSTGAGASELIEDGVNGYLFQAGDADALAAALERILCEKPDRLVRIGRAGQETVCASLDPQAIAAQRLAAYRAAIDAFAARPPARATGWIGEICRPSQPSGQSDMAFLEHLPLRGLAAHVAERVSRRILSR